MRRFSGIFLGLAMIYLGIVCVHLVLQAHATVRANWALTVAVGLAASLTLAGVVAGVWRINQRRIRARWLKLVLILGSGGVLLVGTTYISGLTGGSAPQTVTTAFRLGAVAFMIPLYTLVGALVAWALWPKRKDRSLW